MTPPRKPTRLDASAIASLIVTVEGSKAIKDVDFAALLGISLPDFYKRIGHKLWILKSPAYYKLSKRYARGRLDSQPALAFTQSGVMMVASILGDDTSLDVGMDIVYALRNRRRDSVHKRRPSRRHSDPAKAARYYEAMARMLQGRLHELLKKMRH
ncbi:hypothetical protein [Steroidobacter agaridevorans]|uniref:hypothetical protein n=1 Tax=Steroidobacter agaridevorans TaxID=2695856 RepID=UPI00132706C4|nr:hypothetical protein [Steroidobacter agaridevorans]GFE88953.1 hypothetical protein GCM10011488_39070 [Steroidobacter agaridevorans]